MTKRLARLSVADAARGIYIDYEGNEDRAPSVLGWCCSGQVCHIIVEPALASLERLQNPKFDVRVASLEDALREVMERAEAEGRRVFGYTGHEVRQTTNYCGDPDVVKWTRKRYLNSKRYIDRLVRALVESGAIDEPEDGSLLSRMPLVGIAYPVSRGRGTVGPGLSRLRGQLERHGDPELMSPGSKRHWWRIIGHNWVDVVATQRLTIEAARYLYTSATPRDWSDPRPGAGPLWL